MTSTFYFTLFLNINKLHNHLTHVKLVLSKNTCSLPFIQNCICFRRLVIVNNNTVIMVSKQSNSNYNADCYIKLMFSLFMFCLWNSSSILKRK